MNNSAIQLDTLKIELINYILKVEEVEKLLSLKKQIDFFASFGTWKSEESAEELAQEIQNARFSENKDINFD
jgi:hypothetical protein